ncbi:hypothetical protein BDV30DRAFT_220314 [Aspergillus minisclerotigenes]|uniref:Uncharacterized protein n=1 Tax=Aspergillus minisclerotigenes TaxID=656917 RepID=A0A5N6ILQ3_9EURO|nr:hypothetical protein BDV30DRAFT_220314 [Aspergillus minisclerotigenes]
MKYQAPETFFQLLLGIIFFFLAPFPSIVHLYCAFRDPVKLSLSVGILFFSFSLLPPLFYLS